MSHGVGVGPAGFAGGVGFAAGEAGVAGDGDGGFASAAGASDFFAACKSKYGYIYLDGNHSYEGCRFDFEESLKVATDGALIVLHDVAVTQPGFGVNQLFAELDESHYSKILIPAWPGLGIVQRKAEE